MDVYNAWLEKLQKAVNFMKDENTNFDVIYYFKYVLRFNVISHLERLRCTD